MIKFYIPEKEKCPKNGYQVKYSKNFIEEICQNPNEFNSNLFVGAINDAMTIYKYSDYLTRNWIEFVINSLSPYIK